MFTDFILALSVANMVYISVWLKYFYKINFYIGNLATAQSFLALMLNELILAGLFWLIIKWVRRYDHKVILKIAKIVFCFLVLCFLYLVAICFKDYFDTTLAEYILLIATIVLILFRKMTKVTIKVVLLLAPLVIMIFAQCFTGIIKDLSKGNPESQPVFYQSSPGPRVIWMIFDEMDQAIAFPDRSNTLQLPEFDRFKKDSFYAENAYSPSNHTLTSIPALIDGEMLSNVQIAGIDNLQITYRETNRTVRWGSQPNVFSKVRELKLNTALVGDYLPYSRLIGANLNYCYWTPFRYDFVSANDNVLAHMGAQFYGLIFSSILPFERQKTSYRESFTRAKSLVVDPKYNLIMFHFPIPHSPFINKRNCWDNYYDSSGYNDALALADKTFGDLRRIMEKDGSWEKTTILVSADHWLRDRPKDKKMDYRVPFILKFAGQSDGVLYKPAFNTVLTKELILAILRHEVVNNANLVKWLNEHRSNSFTPQLIKID